MKKIVSFIIAALMLLGTATSAFAAVEDYNVKTTPETHKAILDTDMGYLNDDAIVLFMLAQADSLGWVDFLGVTTVGGNTWVPAGTTAALKQLELIGRPDIPVYMGTDVPIMGFRNIAAEEALWGAAEYRGAYGSLDTRPTDYKALPEEPRYGYAETPAQDAHAIDFIIEQVHKYPGQVTLFCIGAGTNIALAVRKDPTIVEDAKEIIYMGGSIDVRGNSNAAAEFNWYYDPEGIKIVLNSAWKDQLVVPNDVAEQVFYNREIFDRIVAQQGNTISNLIVEGQTQRFTDDPARTSFVWDSITAAMYLLPEIGTDIQDRYVDVETQYGSNYGRAIGYWSARNRDVETGEGMPYGAQKCRVLFDIDRDTFWNFYVDLLTTEVPAAQ